MRVPSSLSASKGSPPWRKAREQGYVAVRLYMAATLGAIPGPSIDAAQWVSMLVSSTTTVRGIRSQERRVGVPVHRCEYAHDEGRGLSVTREL
jgi:hypothetical protein